MRRMHNIKGLCDINRFFHAIYNIIGISYKKNKMGMQSSKKFNNSVVLYICIKTSVAAKEKTKNESNKYEKSLTSYITTEIKIKVFVLRRQ